MQLIERWNGLASETKYVHVFTYLTTHGPGLACHDTPVVHSQLKASVNLALVRWKRHPASFPLKHRVDWDTTRTEEVAIVHQNRIIESCLTHTRRNCGGALQVWSMQRKLPVSTSRCSEYKCSESVGLLIFL